MNCQRHLFDLPESVHYLNCAYMGPLLRQSALAGQQAVLRKSRPYEIQAPDFFTGGHELRRTFAQLIQADEPERIAVIPSVSYGMANAAANVAIEPGQQILLLGDQFPSNYYPWQRLARERGAELRIIAAPQSLQRAEAWNAVLLEAIDEATAVVAMPQVHWTDGTLFDLAAVRAATDRVGALLIIDGTQSVGALPFDMNAIRPDALIVAGYKWLLGPYGLSLAYYGPTFDEGIPIEDSWLNRRDSEDFQGLVQYQDQYRPMAGRYSVGEQANFIMLPMLQTALEQIQTWGIENIQTYCRELCGPYFTALVEMGVRLDTADARAAHLFGLQLPDDCDVEQLKEAFKRRAVHVSFRGNSIRVAPHLYNQAADMEALVDAFRSVLVSGKRSFNLSL